MNDRDLGFALGNGQDCDDPRSNTEFRAAWDKLATGEATRHIIEHIKGELCEPAPALAEVVRAFFKAGALFSQQVSDVIRICGGPMALLSDLDADVSAHWRRARQEEIDGVEDREEAHKAGIPRALSLAAFLKTAKPPEFLVEPMIQRGYLYTLTALTFHGKTTLLILLAICIAAGRSFANCHTVQGRVMYFAGENPDDVAQKFLVACRFLGLDPAQLPITIVPGAFDLAANMDSAIKAAEAGGPVALNIIDTSAAYRFDESEDDNQTSKLWGQWLRRLLHMRGKPATIVAAHPIKHAKAKADLLPRGGGGFLNEIDGNLVLWADLDRRTTELHWTGKLRGPGFPPISFDLREVDHPTWTFHDGKPVPSAVAVPAPIPFSEKKADPSKNLTGHTKGAYDALIDALVIFGAKGALGFVAVTEDQWRDRFYAKHGAGAGPDAKQKAFRRAATTLINGRLVAKEGGERVGGSTPARRRRGARSMIPCTSLDVRLSGPPIPTGHTTTPYGGGWVDVRLSGPSPRTGCPANVGHVRPKCPATNASSMLTRPPDPAPAAELEALAGEVRRLRPDWRDAEGFYEARSEIAGALMRLSRRLAGRSMPAPMPIPRPMPVRAVAVAVPPPPKLVAPSAMRPIAAPPRPRRTTTRRHRYPMPPTDAQSRFI